MGRYALVVGNSKYIDADLRRLTTPEVDVEAFSETLRDPNIGKFDKVVTLSNEQSSTIRKAIASLFAHKFRDDLLLFYFSGHGVLDEHGMLYLAATDTERDLLNGTAIEAGFIKNLMDQSHSARQILILDCCHSGAFGRGTKSALNTSVGTKGAFEGTGFGRVVLTATDATQFAWEGDQVIGQAQKSVFTHFLVNGLKSGDADLNGDGEITVNELYHFVYNQVMAETPRQTPMIWSYKQQGEITVAINPQAGQYLKRLPEEIRDCMDDPRPTVRMGVVMQLERMLNTEDKALARAALLGLEQLKEDSYTQVARAAEKVLKNLASHSSARATPPQPLPTQKPDQARTQPPPTKVSTYPVSPSQPDSGRPPITQNPSLPYQPSKSSPSGVKPVHGRRSGTSSKWIKIIVSILFICLSLTTCLFILPFIFPPASLGLGSQSTPTVVLSQATSQPKPTARPTRTSKPSNTPTRKPTHTFTVEKDNPPSSSLPLDSFLDSDRFQIDSIRDNFVDNKAGWDFASYDDEVGKATFEITDGFLHIIWDSKKDGYATFREFPQATFKDLAIGTQVDLSHVSKYGIVGLFLRRQDQETGYEFMISNNGYYRFSKRVGNETTRLVDWTESDAIAVNGNNSLVLVAVESYISAAVNDLTLFQLEDETLTEGAAGLYVGNQYQGYQDEFIFDSFTILSLAKK